jgi:hypothetical protein
MINEPIYKGLLQSDLDCAGFNLLNFPGGGGGGGGGGLDANTVVATDVGMVGDGVTDNTSALQAWLTSVETAKVNSTLLVPDGVYIFSGALQDGSVRNAQILLPTVLQTDHAYSVTIKGYHPIMYTTWPSQAGLSGAVPIPKGPIFKSTLNTASGTQPAFMGGNGPNPPGFTEGLSWLNIGFENMIFQMPLNPQLSCLNLNNITNVEFRGNVLVIAGTGIGEDDVVQPTTTTSYGVILPKWNRAVLHQVNNLNVFNFYNGLLFGELTHAINLHCVCCVNAIEIPFSYHTRLIQRLMDWHCINGINVTGSVPGGFYTVFQIAQHAIECNLFGGWKDRVYDVIDPSNVAQADITYLAIANSAYHTYTMNGGAGIKVRRAGSAYDLAPIYVGTDLRLVSIAGGGKLQARNTATNTWADVDQWTNP